jgi:adenosylcobinamide-GDP ribazoletransferase
VATLAAAAAALAICGLGGGAAALGTAFLVAVLATMGARRAVAGRTGDTLGATVAITEVAACVALLAVWHG